MCFCKLFLQVEILQDFLFERFIFFCFYCLTCYLTFEQYNGKRETKGMKFLKFQTKSHRMAYSVMVEIWLVKRLQEIFDWLNTCPQPTPNNKALQIQHIFLKKWLYTSIEISLGRLFHSSNFNFVLCCALEFWKTRNKIGKKINNKNNGTWKDLCILKQRLGWFILLFQR